MRDHLDPLDPLGGKSASVQLPGHRRVAKPFAFCAKAGDSRSLRLIGAWFDFLRYRLAQISGLQSVIAVTDFDGLDM